MASNKFQNDENREMVANNNKQIRHHTSELDNAVKGKKHIPAWVVSKVGRSASDLSDATHYLEGSPDTMMAGGSISDYKIGDKIEFINQYDKEKRVGVVSDIIPNKGFAVSSGFSTSLVKVDDILGRVGSKMMAGGKIKESYLKDLSILWNLSETYYTKFLDLEDYYEKRDAYKLYKEADKQFYDEVEYVANQYPSINKGEIYDELENYKRNINTTDKKMAGGNIQPIEKKVAEVNELIEMGNKNNVNVTDTSSTWQSPMKYKPFVYKNGVLYENYDELDLYLYSKKGEKKWRIVKHKYTKIGDGVDTQKEVLNNVAKMYRKELKYYADYDNYLLRSKGKMMAGGFLTGVAVGVAGKWAYDKYGKKIKKKVKSKFEDGGQMNELFPETDAMSYGDGGSIGGFTYQIGGLI